MVRSCFVFLLLFICVPAWAQSPDTPKKDGTAEKAPSLVKGRLTIKAPPSAQRCQEFLDINARSETEFYADDKGGLSIHKGVSAKRLRFLATELEKVEGVRQALTDTPRRMILLIFKSSPKNTTPPLVAAALEQIRKRYKESLKARGSTLGAGGTDKKSPGDNKDTSKKDPVKPPKVIKAGPKKKEAVMPVLKRGFYSYYSPKITEATLRQTKVSGPITSVHCLNLWLAAKDRPQAVVIARKVLAKHPKDNRAGAVLAMYHLHTGNKMKAYRNMRTVIHYNPDVAVYRAMYAEVLYAMKMERVAKEQEDMAKKLSGLK
ncbi:MAG: hypothetical protein P1V97_04690 [Planctomycetota bacterium]|nr:hypothetical protein [Planctomycetota bacterium]